jgi:hypothetical protein
LRKKKESKKKQRRKKKTKHKKIIMSYYCPSLNARRGQMAPAPIGATYAPLVAPSSANGNRVQPYIAGPSSVVGNSSNAGGSFSAGGVTVQPVVPGAECGTQSGFLIKDQKSASQQPVLFCRQPYPAAGGYVAQQPQQQPSATPWAPAPVPQQQQQPLATYPYPAWQQTQGADVGSAAAPGADVQPWMDTARQAVETIAPAAQRFY